MKKTGRMGRLAGMFLAAVMTVTSCYDDSALVERVTQLEYNVEALQLQLTEELDALNALMDENIYIKKCESNDDGSYTLTLSSGDVFTVYPDQSLKSVVTYISMSGTKYWAYYDENGTAQLMTDANGSRIPITVVPKVTLEDGTNYLVFGNEKYPLSGNSVFSDYEIHTDEYGDVISATFTFGKDMTFTVPVGNGNGIRFVFQNIDQLVTLTEQFVSYGRTENVQIELKGVVDYLWKEPKGWTVEEYEDDYGYMYLSITAPSKAEIEAGAAAESGVLKVVSVLEGNGAGVSRLQLTANPFNRLTVSADEAAIEVCFGLQKYAYGVCTKSDFDEAVILAKAEELLTSSGTQTGYALAESGVEVSISALYGSEMTPGEEYVFWAMPAIYDEETGFMFVEGSIQTKEFVHKTLLFELDEENITFRDAPLKMELKGATEYYGGIFEKPELDGVSTLFGNILPYIEGGDIQPITTPMSFDGSAFEFAGADLTPEPNTAYIVWMIVPETGKTTYTEEDVRYFEFTTDQLSSGSSIEVAVEATPGYVDATATLSAEGAELIFYSFMKATTAAGYSTDELRVKYLLENGEFVKSETAEVATDPDTKYDAGTKLTLLALAVDKNGSYGAVKVQDVQLNSITYNNDLAVALTMVTNEPNNVVVNVSSAAGVEYIYWIGKPSNNFWTSSKTLGGSAAKASKYMFLNPTESRFIQTAESYPMSDGQLIFDDLSLKTDYVLVVMARKEIGGKVECSSASVLRFPTKAMALGTIVTEAEDPVTWAAAKPTVQWDQSSFTAATALMSGMMGYTVTPPDGVNLTYYVMSGTDSYFTDGAEEFDLSTDDFIISIVEQTDKMRQANVHLVEDWVYPNDYKFYDYMHGFSSHGYAMIFPNADEHDAICSCGGCKTGTTTVKDVENLPWEQKVYYYSDCPLKFVSSAVGSEGVDKVYITCRDADGNYYEPFVFPVPYEYFLNAGSRDE